MNKVSLSAWACLTLLGIWAAPASAAPSTGDTVTCTASSFNCSQGSATVGSGAEFTASFVGNPYLAADFSQGLLTVRNARGSAFTLSGGFSLTFSDLTQAFTQATFAQNSGFTGVDQSKVSLSGGALSLNLNDFHANDASAFFTVQLGPTAPQLGETVTCAAQSFSCSQGSATVGNGSEFTASFVGNPYLSVDFSQGLLVVRNVRGSDFTLSGGFSLTFSDPTQLFTEATFAQNSGFTGVDQSKISLSSGKLTLNLNDFHANNDGAFFAIQLGTTAAAAPEPATWTMMLAGLGVAGVSMRRRRRASMTASFA